MVRVGVIGYGYWGPNIVRNLHQLDDCEVTVVCDLDEGARRTDLKISAMYASRYVP